VVVSTQIAQVKAANPDLLIVNVGFGYGPIWQAIQSAGWSPKILTSAGAWYDGFSAMGALASTSVAPYTECVTPNHPAFTHEQTTLMDGYAGIFGASSVNYLTFVSTDNVPLELLKYAIEKYHSVDPNAIKQALEGIHNQDFLGLTYDITPTNHFGLTGVYGANTCTMSPFSDGPYRVPFVAS
jgi:ABC-type branched-subunit amino acid transport system substrate-binding protein